MADEITTIQIKKRSKPAFDEIHRELQARAKRRLYQHDVVDLMINEFKKKKAV